MAEACAEVHSGNNAQSRHKWALNDMEQAKLEDARKPRHPALSHHRSTSSSPPIKANPDAIDSSSAPAAILA